MQIVLLVSYGLDGLAHAAEALGGHATGANNQVRLKAICRSVFLWGGILGLGATITYLCLQTEIIFMFTTIHSIANIVNLYFVWVALLPMLALWSYLLDGIFLGLGEMRRMRNTMLAATGLFYLLWWLTRPMGNEGL